MHTNRWYHAQIIPWIRVQ